MISKRDADGHARPLGVPAVVQVVPAFVVINVDIVRLVPAISPVLWVSVHDVKPIAPIVESRMSPILPERLPIDAEAMIRAELGSKLALGNAEAMIAPSLPPVTVL